MLSFKPILLSGYVFIVFTSCTKNNSGYVPLASLTLVHAMVGDGAPIVANFGSTGYFSQAIQISFAGSSEFALPAGKNAIMIAQYPDTAQIDFSGIEDLGPGSIYSLFLTGTDSQPDTLMVTDIIPQYVPGDSVTGLRFVNCSRGSLPFSVNVQGNPAASLVNSLAYKQVTPFLSLPAGTSVTGYMLEIRDAASGNLLVSFPMSTTLFENQTIVIAGQEAKNASVPLTVFTYNNF